MSGGPGNDRLNGRPRSELLFGGRGNDLIRGATTVFPGSGTNRVDVADGRRDDRAATSDVARLSRSRLRPALRHHHSRTVGLWVASRTGRAALSRPRSVRTPGMVHDVPLHGVGIGGYTRDGDAGPGSRGEPDMILATVTRELEPTLPLGTLAWVGGLRALDLGVRRPPASLCSGDPRAMEGAVDDRVHL